VARYTYAPGSYIDDVARQERDLNADDDFGDDDEVVYYLSNVLWSVYGLADADENVVERYRYDAYGLATVLDDDWSADADGYSDVGNPYTFTGRRLDVAIGLMQYRHRNYHTTLGRFISRDPEGSWWLSLYEYAGSRPCQEPDPSGLKTIAECYAQHRRCVAQAAELVADCLSNAILPWGLGEVVCVIVGGVGGIGAGLVCTAGNTLLNLGMHRGCLNRAHRSREMCNRLLEICLAHACG
jgi:RHS repeat-associated protein